MFQVSLLRFSALGTISWFLNLETCVVLVARSQNSSYRGYSLDYMIFFFMLFLVCDPALVWRGGAGLPAFPVLSTLWTQGISHASISLPQGITCSFTLLYMVP